MTCEAGLDQVLAILWRCMSNPRASRAAPALVTVCAGGGCHVARGVFAYLAIHPCDAPYSGAMGCCSINSYVAI